MRSWRQPRRNERSASRIAYACSRRSAALPPCNGHLSAAKREMMRYAPRSGACFIFDYRFSAIPCALFLLETFFCLLSSLIRSHNECLRWAMPQIRRLGRYFYRLLFRGVPQHVAATRNRIAHRAGCSSAHAPGYRPVTAGSKCTLSASPITNSQKRKAMP